MNYEAVKDQVSDRLSEELNDALFLHGLVDSNLEAFIAKCKNIDNRVRSRNKKRKATGGQVRFSAIQSRN